MGGGGGGTAGVWADLSSNYVFVVGFCGWFLAQFLKIFTKRYKQGGWDARAFLDSGGMPSSHSALCSSVTTAIAMQQGLGSPLFAVAGCFRCAGAGRGGLELQAATARVQHCCLRSWQARLAPLLQVAFCDVCSPHPPPCTRFTLVPTSCPSSRVPAA
jgi:hypothetical protein